jgi:hypothetical protein
MSPQISCDEKLNGNRRRTPRIGGCIAIGSGVSISWRRLYDDPTALPRGRQIVTLRDAASYIKKLPKTEEEFDC